MTVELEGQGKAQGLTFSFLRGWGFIGGLMGSNGSAVVRKQNSKVNNIDW